jgi:hypothetical protein
LLKGAPAATMKRINVFTDADGIISSEYGAILAEAIHVKRQ